MTATAFTPETAAAYAMRDGGFTTPAIEAYRILEDACRTIKAGHVLPDPLQQSVANVLAWDAEHTSDPEAERERTAWTRQRQVYEDNPALTFADLRTRLEPLVHGVHAVTPAPYTPPGPAPTRKHAAAPEGGSVDVTPVLVDVRMIDLLREQIKELQGQLRAHEDMVRDALGGAVEGTDEKGNVVVTQPIRNRSNFNKSEAQKRMSPEDFAACETHTTYRPLLIPGKGK